MGRSADALAANDVARRLPIARRDPLFASLGHARHAVIHAVTGDSRATRQALGHAQNALHQADPSEPRPTWMTAVCDQAEIEELALSAHLTLGNYEDAEAHAHKSLALLRPHMQRDRAIVTARLAHAQLGQGDVEPAVTTAMSIPTEAADQHPRVMTMLRSFSNGLRVTAPASPHIRTWDQYTHDAPKKPQ
ncbi:hypothetical protein ACFV0C_33185 [Streptomyces sp. NPDC059568]|uniref:hypothetical protein n=1 Tax=Streptomyces sp. NPDC059568 TaxID=3346868 RepID=UPI0036ABDD04